MKKFLLYSLISIFALTIGFGIFGYADTAKAQTTFKQNKINRETQELKTAKEALTKMYQTNGTSQNERDTAKANYDMAATALRNSTGNNILSGDNVIETIPNKAQANTGTTNTNKGQEILNEASGTSLNGTNVTSTALNVDRNLAKDRLDTAESDLSWAKQDGNKEDIATAQAEYDQALSDYNSANSKWENAKKAEAQRGNDSSLSLWNVASWGLNLAFTILNAIMTALNYLAGLIADLAAYLMSFAITKSLMSTESLTAGGTAATGGLAPSIIVSWTILRDAINIIFIFVLLYISISTILQVGNYQAKNLLVKVIIAALLINFSLFIGKVVIDLGNSAGVAMYNQVKTIQIGESDGSIGQNFQAGLKLLKTQESPGGDWLTNGSKMFAQLTMSIIVNLVAAFVFFMVAFLFIGRLIAFFFLLVLAPVGFLGMVLPNIGQKYSSMWWDNLFKQSLMAPIFLVFLYMIMKMMETFKMSADPSASLAAAGEIPAGGWTFNDFFPYILIIGALIIALKITKSMAGEVGNVMTKVGGAALGAGVALATGGTAAIMRNTAGRVGSLATKSNEDLQKMADSGGIQGGLARRALNLKTSAAGGNKAAMLALKAGEKASKNTFDARNSKLIGGAMGQIDKLAGTGFSDTTKGYLSPKSGPLAAQKKGGYEQIMKDRQEKVNDQADLVGKHHNEKEVEKSEKIIEETKKTDKFKDEVLKNQEYKKANDGKTDATSRRERLVSLAQKETDETKRTIQEQEIKKTDAEIKSYKETMDEIENATLSKLAKQGDVRVGGAMSVVRDMKNRENFAQSIESGGGGTGRAAAIGAGAGLLIPGIGPIVGAAVAATTHAIVGRTKQENSELANNIRKGKKTKSDEEKLAEDLEKFMKKRKEESGESGETSPKTPPSPKPQNP